MPYDDGQQFESSSDKLEELEENLLYLNSSLGEIYSGIAMMLIYLFGSSLSMVVSYFDNRSIPWAIGHGLLSWGYVIYHAIFK